MLLTGRSMGNDCAEWLMKATCWLLVATSCHATAPSRVHVPASRVDPLESRLGWLQGPCLAIKNSHLKPGTSAAVVILSTPQVVREVRLGARTHSAITCPALANGRAVENDQADMSFYAIAAQIEPNDVGVAIIEPVTMPEVTAGVARIDLDADGRSEVFSSCSTSEGLEFQVKGSQGEARWSGYEYLAYDLEPNCP